jgi:hypothetical protein
MRQSTLPFKREKDIPKRDDQFKRKALATRRSKPLSNHKDDPIEPLSDHASTPDKKETKRGGRPLRDRKCKK